MRHYLLKVVEKYYDRPWTVVERQASINKTLSRYKQNIHTRICIPNTRGSCRYCAGEKMCTVRVLVAAVFKAYAMRKQTVHTSHKLL